MTEGEIIEEEEYKNQYEIFDVEKIFSVSVGNYTIKKNEIETEEWYTNESKKNEKNTNRSKKTTKNMDDSFFKTMDEDYFSMIEEEDILGYEGEGDEKIQFKKIISTNNLISILLTNDILILILNQNKQCLYKTITYFKDNEIGVSCISFEENGKYIGCVTNDRKIYIISVKKYFKQEEEEEEEGKEGKEKEFPSLFSFQKNEMNFNFLKEFDQQEEEGEGEDIKLISKKKIIEKSKGTEMTDCLWWKTFDGENNYLIISTEKGSLIFFNLQLQNVDLVLNGFETSIKKIELITDFKNSCFTYILIHSKKGKFYKLLLEQFDFEFHNFKNVIQFYKENEILLNQFNSNNEMTNQNEFCKIILNDFIKLYPCKINVIKDKKKGNLISLFSKLNKQLSIFDPNQSKYPLYIYQLDENTKKVYENDSILFSIQKNQNEIWIISKILAGTSFNSKMKLNSLFQKIKLNNDEFIKQIIYLNEKDYYIFTNQSIFRLFEKESKKEIFYNLILKQNEKEKAEIFGKTFSLDILNLYEKIGNELFKSSLTQHDNINHSTLNDAISLFKLSNIDQIKYIKLLISIKRYKQSIDEIEIILKNPTVLQHTTRIELSNLLFDLYILTDNHEKLNSFLLSNQYFDSKKIIEKLININKINEVIQFSHKKNEMKYLFEVLNNMNSFNKIMIIESNLNFLIENNYSIYFLIHLKLYKLLLNDPILKLKIIIDNLSKLQIYFDPSIKEEEEEEEKIDKYFKNNLENEFIYLIPFLKEEQQDENVLIKIIQKFHKLNFKIYSFSLLFYLFKFKSFSDLYQEKLENLYLNILDLQEICLNQSQNNNTRISNNNSSSKMTLKEIKDIESFFILNSYKFKNDLILSIIFKNKEEYIESFQFKLRYYKLKKDLNNNLNEIIYYLEEIILKNSSIEYQIKLFLNLINFWKEEKLNFEYLEKELNFNIFGKILYSLLFDDYLNEILMNNFSNNFFLKVTKHFLKESSFNNTMNNVVNSITFQQDNLQHQIFQNIEKDILKFDHLQILNLKSNNIKIFTCGHQFDLNEFKDKILIDFRSKIKEIILNNSNQKYLNSFLILQNDYQKNVSNNSCPLCTFKYFLNNEINI
eukprot:gene5399-9212_t